MSGLIAGLVALAAVAIWAAPAEAAFPGGNGKIVYAGGFGGEKELRVVGPQGGAGTPFLTNPSGNDTHPAFSPDGSAIAYETTSGGTFNVAVARGDGSGDRVLLTGHSREKELPMEYIENYYDPGTETTYPWVGVVRYEDETSQYYTPTFMPTGDSLLVAHTHGQWTTEAVCEVEAEGGECGAFVSYDVDGEVLHSLLEVDVETGAVLRTVLTDPEISLDDPTVAVDGAIAYHRGGQVHLLAPGDDAPKPIYSGAATVDFSPDGSRLAVAVPGQGAIVIDRSGTERSLVLPLPFPGAQTILTYAVRYSPDGTKLALGTLAFNAMAQTIEQSVQLLRLDGTGAGTRIAVNQNTFDLAWQPLVAEPPVPPPDPGPPLSAPPPSPPAASAKAKRAVKLAKDGGAVVGTVSCRTGACELAVAKAKLRIGRKLWQVTLTAPRRLAAGRSAKVRVKVGGKALAALRAAGSGRLEAALRLAGAAAPLAFKPTVKPPAQPGRARKA